MNKPPISPICCGEEAQWVVQSVSLAYFYCKVCKTEPGVVDKKDDADDTGEMPMPPYYFNQIGGNYTPVTAQVTHGGHTFMWSSAANSNTCTVCGMFEIDYNHYGTTCMLATNAQAAGMMPVTAARNSPHTHTLCGSIYFTFSNIAKGAMICSQCKTPWTTSPCTNLIPVKAPATA